MVKVKSRDVRDHAKAGLEAFGKKGPVKGPVGNKRLPKEPDADDGAAPGTYRPHKEPDADDMNPGPQPFPPFKKKVGKGEAKGPASSKKIKAGKAGNMPAPFKMGKKEKIK